MTWLCVDKDGSEWVFDGAPKRGETGWYITFEATSCVGLPKGSIKKHIGKKLTW